MTSYEPDAPDNDKAFLWVSRLLVEIVTLRQEKQELLERLELIPNASEAAKVLHEVEELRREKQQLTEHLDATLKEAKAAQKAHKQEKHQIKFARAQAVGSLRYQQKARAEDHQKIKQLLVDNYQKDCEIASLKGEPHPEKPADIMEPPAGRKRKAEADIVCELHIKGKCGRPASCKYLHLEGEDLQAARKEFETAMEEHQGR